MARSAERNSWVKVEFDRLAPAGCLGDPVGRPAAAYLRVSSAGQAEEGRSGFPRQLQHVHEKAQAVGVYVPWEHVYFDDHTGFEFRDRPALTRLRDMLAQPNRPIADLVLENLDRLSREASWHQGFLLEELEKSRGVQVHFWKELGSRIERAVYGTVAQDRMLTDLERMAKGNLLKAKSGRVTARTPAYGYSFVNRHGGAEDVRKDTHYTLHEPEARVMRDIYVWLAQERATLFEISRRLTQQGAPLPKQSRVWEPTLLRVLARNPVYKGEFYAHRYTYIKTTSRRTGRMVTRKIERPREEWIPVPVPPLVSVAAWEAAQRAMTENRVKSLRNSKEAYLLTGLLQCAGCQARFVAGRKTHRKQTRQGPREYPAHAYRCASRHRPKHIQAQLGLCCVMPQMAVGQLDKLVWNAIVGVLFDAQRLNEGMDRYFARQGRDSVAAEAAYLQAELTRLDLEDELLYQAYLSKAFTADEYAAKRQKLRVKRVELETEQQAALARQAHQALLLQRRESILASAQALRERAGSEIPFELKRKVVTLVVDKIVLNTQEGWFELEGAIAGAFDIIPKDTGSWRPQAGSWRGR